MKARNAPKTKNGAKGISLFILILSPFFLFLERMIRAKPIIVPDQKAITRPDSALVRPNSQPMPRANLASPKPIHLPEDISQKMAKGDAINKPDKNSKIDGMCK